MPHIAVRPRISKLFGMTPMTVHSSPSSLSSLPTIDGIAIEPRFPQSFADHDDAATLLLIFGRKRPAGDRLDAEHVEDA